MDDPRRVDVAYIEGHWIVPADPDFAPFDFPTLTRLITAVQRSDPFEALVFVIDHSTVRGYVEAEAQFIEASETSVALICSSAHNC